MTISRATIDWLLQSDPAVAWQTQRDLLGRAQSTWQRTRKRVAKEGWGARLLAERAGDGTWGGGLYSPKWTSTFYTLRLLTQLGISPNHHNAKASCELLIDKGVTEDGGVSLWRAPWVDTCVTAMLLHMACYYGLEDDPRTQRMATWLLGEQMSDGGWNCRKTRGEPTHSSFHTTISTLEGFAALADAGDGRRRIQRASKQGREFFLRHQLYRSCRTGNVVKSSFARFSFPPRWNFDVLRGLEHFAAVDARWDDRLADPVDVLHARRTDDDRWTSQNKHTGPTYFEFDKARQPSPINTLRALRVLAWVERVRR